MTSSEPDVCVVLMTAPDRETAARLARSLVEERLAACVNVVPELRSIYRWEGAVQEETEVLLVAKTRRDCCDALTERVRVLHPYDVPEVLALGAVGGSRDYLEWVATETAP
ncbi:MAG: divalent-cation tolerance protein CutA [Proteobacteria bacterium]|nr:divalent-cation tolerance protein CutA [Pseudomonadota bacterium]